MFGGGEFRFHNDHVFDVGAAVDLGQVVGPAVDAGGGGSAADATPGTTPSSSPGFAGGGDNAGNGSDGKQYDL